MPCVLVCGITQSDVTIHFTSSILRMQTELIRTPGLAVEFELFPTVNDALTHFHATPRFDLCVVLDGQMAVSPNFMLHHDLTKPLTIASYPLRCFDWTRVKEKITADHEPPHLTGVVYNYDPSVAIPQPGGTCVKIPAGTSRDSLQFKIFKITREGLNTILTTHGDKVCHADRLVMYTEGIEDGAYMSKDQRFAWLWGGDIYADITATTKNMGPYDFSGTVGTRKQLR